MPRRAGNKTAVSISASAKKAIEERAITLGKNIRAERKNRNFTMDELVDMLSISEAYLGLLERGKRTPSIECLLELCTIFGVTPNDLLLPRAGTKKALKANDSVYSPKNKSYDAALSLLRSLDKDELEFTVTTMTAMKKMTTNSKRVHK